MTAGTVVWMTGLPASGKSTLAQAVHAQLVAHRVSAAVLDSDELRRILHADGYGDAERDELYRRLAALAAYLAGQGLVVLVPATAARRAHREVARQLAPRFVEVWVRTSLAECEARDPKGLYARARSGATTLPGVGAPYEVPLAPDVIAEGGNDGAAVAALVARLLGQAASGPGRGDPRGAS